MQVLASLKGISKSYGGTAVLRDVSLAVGPGEVVALLGGNGAGKSTLMRVLAGLTAPDAGTVTITGQPLLTASPRVAQDLGLYLVPQETHIFPSRSVLENVAMGLPQSPLSYAGRIKGLARDLGVDLRLDARGATLEVADRQVVEIMRGLLRQARVLVLDEPTSALTPREAGALFERMRALRASGVAQILISHKLHELRQICDRVVVLRDGAVVLEGRLDDLDDNAIIAAMSPGLSRAAQVVGRPDAGTEALRLDELAGEGFSGASFTLHRGEVLGLAGVIGAGRTELAETLVGLRPAQSGQVFIGGRPLPRSWGPRRAVEAGLVLLSEDRQRHGLFLEAGNAANVSALLAHRLPAVLRPHREAVRFEKLRRLLSIRCQGPWQATGRLSGGNQQKVLLARCLGAAPGILLLDEPTRGVDATARQDIYRLVGELAASGTAILLISSDFEEVARLATRTIVMAGGRLAGELPGDASADEIAAIAFGAGPVVAGQTAKHA